MGLRNECKDSLGEDLVAYAQRVIVLQLLSGEAVPQSNEALAGIWVRITDSAVRIGGRIVHQSLQCGHTP